MRVVRWYRQAASTDAQETDRTTGATTEKMSQFVASLKRSGFTVQQRYSARGRTGFGGGGARINVNIKFPLPAFIDRVVTKEKNVLYKTGRYAMRVYRTQLRRRPPVKRTKTGKIRKRYREEITQGAIRPPYYRTGILYRSTDFVVDESRGTVIAGPPKITGLQRTSKSKQPLPGLLDQGGPALVLVTRGRRRQRGGRTEWVEKQYRQFPYQQTVFEKTHPFMLRKIAETPL